MTNSKTPEIWIMLAKYTSSIIGDGDTIHWDPKETAKVDWEVELAVVIGKRALSSVKKTPSIMSSATPSATT